MTSQTLEIDREEFAQETPKQTEAVVDVNTEIRAIVDHVKDRQIAERYFAENPFIVLGAAVGIGYILGGGLLSPFSRRIARIGMKAMVLPIAANQLKTITGSQDPKET